MGIGAQQDSAHVVLLEVQHHAEDLARELQQLARHGFLQAVDPGDAVAHGDDLPDLLELDARLVAGDTLLDDLANLFGSNFHGFSLPPQQRFPHRG